MQKQLVWVIWIEKHWKRSADMCWLLKCWLLGRSSGAWWVRLWRPIDFTAFSSEKSIQRSERSVQAASDRSDDKKWCKKCQMHPDAWIERDGASSALVVPNLDSKCSTAWRLVSCFVCRSLYRLEVLGGARSVANRARFNENIYISFLQSN